MCPRSAKAVGLMVEKGVIALPMIHAWMSPEAGGTVCEGMVTTVWHDLNEDGMCIQPRV